ncbi:FtsK/SpoIIIE domain-containing protein [Campylobacter devanensis]|uniref:FtsK/SpoIIIE domain-containing protein n=1 Tax=Campylobacter devanensis TaxID=3161138 RepID=UPI001F2839BB|nr:FtsK/SpoIIIE domain-containing protein [Campylobacter sp. P0098]
MINDYYDVLLKLDKAVYSHKNTLLQIEKAFPNEMLTTREAERRKYQIEQEKSQFTKLTDPLISELDYIIKKIRNKQSQLSTPSISKKNTFPDFIVFGRYHLHNEYFAKNDKKFLQVPRVLDFPMTRALYSHDFQTIDFVKQLIIRIIQISPLKKLHFTLIDTVGLGESFDFIRTILDNDFMYDQRILTYNNEIEVALKNNIDYIESLIQKQIVGYENWKKYNENNTKNILPLKVLAFVGDSSQLTTNSSLYMERIIKHGSKYGVLPIILIEEETKEEKNKIQTILKNFATEITYKHEKLNDLKGFKAETALESWPHKTDFENILEDINRFYKEESKIKYEINEMWDDKYFWKEKSTEGVYIPIGWDKNQERIDLRIGFDNSEHHTLIGGRSGSGKSNLLHTIIQNCSFLYSPDEVELFLLDYKEGIEFNLYASEKQPLLNSSLIAIQSDIAYGQTFLEHVVKIKNQRAEKFKKENVKDFKEYRNKNYKLSRYIIIIDEFQVLFTIKNSKRIEDLFVEILRKGRSYGIHLILSTQTLRGIEANSLSQLKSQIGNRIALAMGEDDSMSVLSSNNPEAAKIKGKPEAIYNNSGGMKDANKIFFVPYASRDNANILLEKVNSCNCNKNIKIYNGELMPELPDDSIFKTSEKEVLVGKKINFDEDLFRIKFKQESGNSLIISGRGEKHKKSIFDTVLKSLINISSIEHIYLISAKYNNNIEGKIHYCNYDVFNADIKPNSFIVIENFDFETGLYPTEGYSTKDKNELGEKFKSIVEFGYEKNIYTIIFIENYKKIKEKTSKFLTLFELRYGFNMNEDTATSFFSGCGFNTFDAIPQNIGVFLNIAASQMEKFRFFGNKGDEND